MASDLQWRTAWPSANIAIGKQRTGKSTTLKYICEVQHLKGDCCIDLLDFGRHENACYALANTHVGAYDRFNFINRNQDKTWQNRDFKPREFPTVVYVPAVRGMPLRLPSIFQPFRIVFQDLSFEEFLALAGFRGDEVSCDILQIGWGGFETQEVSFSAFVKKILMIAGYGSFIGKVDGKRIEVNVAERRSFAPLFRQLLLLLNSNLLCDRGNSLALDLDAIMQDTSKIHCFSMAYINTISIPYLIYGYILRKIYSLRLKAAEKYPNLSMFLREVQKVAPFSIRYPGQEMSREALSALVKECGDLKTWLYMDTQDPRSIDWNLQGTVIYTWFIFRSDKIIVSWLRERFDIPDWIASSLPKRDVGMCAIKFDDVKSVVLIPPTLSLIKHWSEQFVVLWEKFKGEYRDWDIRFVSADNLITLEVPDKPEDVVSHKELSQFERHVLTWLEFIEQTGGPANLENLCKLVHITTNTAYSHITKLESFKKYLVLNNGIVAKHIL